MTTLSEKTAPPVPPPGAPGPSRNRRLGRIARVPLALRRMVLALIVVVALFSGFGQWPVLVFILAIIAIVMMHEFGHFIAAKWARMKVTQFFVGFGPTLWSVRRGETEYGVKPILAGGFVKIPGMSVLEEVDPQDEDRTYRRQPFHKRIIVSLAGPFTHFVLAVVLVFAALLAYGSANQSSVVVSSFVHWAGHSQNAAQLGGLKVGDQIISVNGKAVNGSGQLDAAIKSSPGRAVHLVVLRDGARKALTVTPTAGHVTKTSESLTGSGKSVGLIGINEEPAVSSVGFVSAVSGSFTTVGRYTADTVTAIPHGVAAVFHQVSSTKAANQAQSSTDDGGRLTSIIGIGRLSVEAEQSGFYSFLMLLIVINIAFGVLNLLPILPFDGGYIAISIYERLRTRRGHAAYQADITKIFPVVAAFTALVLVILISTAYLDIAHPFVGQ